MRTKTLYSDRDEYIHFRMDEKELVIDIELSDGSSAIFWVEKEDVRRLRELIN